MNSTLKNLFFVFSSALLGLSGCVFDRYPVSSSIYKIPGTAPAISAQKGDNLYKVAKRYDVTLQGLIEVNGLRPPYKIHPGQALRLPQKRLHIVRRFETLTSIAHKRNVDIHGLVTMNQLQAPYILHENQRLQLPYPQRPQRRWATRHKSLKKIKSLPPRPLLPAQGSPAPKTSPQTIEPLLPLPKKKQKIEPLLPLKKTPLSPPKKPLVQIVKKPLSATQSIDGLPPHKPTLKPLKKKTSRSVSKTIARQKGSPSKTGPVKPISKFSWPLQGRLLGKYGKKTGGLRNDGINIAAKKGRPIKAAERGHVVYVGSALKGYGKLILIRHRDGWITTYAHCHKTLVSKGESVKKGQIIGHVGSTGNVKRPQLHFEIRKKTRTVDPLSYLR